MELGCPEAGRRRSTGGIPAGRLRFAGLRHHTRHPRRRRSRRLAQGGGPTGRLRAGRARARTGAGVGALWRAPLRRLHQHLIAPIERTGLLVGKQRLVLVPHADLHYLPFAALLEDGSGDRFLIQRYELVEAPSAMVWLALGERRAPGAVSLLALAPRVDALPGSRREVAAISRGASAPKVLLGADATEAAFRREAPNRRALHLATYGFLNKRNPLFSYVELAAGSGHDGRLEVHEIFGLPLWPTSWCFRPARPASDQARWPTCQPGTTGWDSRAPFSTRVRRAWWRPFGLWPTHRPLR